MFSAVRKTNKHRSPTPLAWWLRRATVMATALAVVAAPFVVHADLTAEAASADYVVARQVVSDDLGRTNAQGWGAAPVGGSYSYNTRTTSFLTNGKDGVAKLTKSGASLTSTLRSVSSLNAQASTVVSVPVVPNTGNGIYAGIQVRVKGSTYYQASIRFGTQGIVALKLLRVNGSTSTQTPLGVEKVIAHGVKAGTRVSIEVQVVGTNPVMISGRAWLQGTSTPRWQITATDSSAKRITAQGAVALWSYVSGGSAPQPVSFGNVSAFELKPAQRPTLPAPPPSTRAATPPASAAPSPEPTPTVKPTVPPASTTPDPNPGLDASQARGPAGAATIGTTRYPVPSNALFVSPNGTASAEGTKDSPLASVQAAIDRAVTGATVVLRGGTYHETITIPSNKRLTLQSYPGEAVWFDGSSPVTNWRQSGSVWEATGWNHVFDSSPTYARGAPDGAAPSWSFINPAYPMAAHPDQIWIDGTAQAQVASRAQVKARTFYYDTAAHALYLGSNPSGKSVRASSLSKAISVQGSGSVLRGFGVRRYAPSVPDMGTITAWAGKTTIENLAITDNATTGMSVGGSGVVIRNVTAARNGMLGIHANSADSLTISGLLSVGNNAERFNQGPVSGGTKITRSRGVLVTGSAFLSNRGPGLWLDESVYNARVVNNDSIGNAGKGILVEISSTLTVANNVVSDNGSNGIEMDGVSDVQIWNNTVSNNAGRNLNLVMGDRRASNRSTAGHDPRQPFPDPTMSWITKSVTVSDNIIVGGGGNCMLCMEDYSHQFSASQLKITADGNVYQQSAKTPQRWAVVWSRGAGDPAVYDTFALFTAATGQESHGLVLAASASALTSTNRASALVSAADGSVARSLPPAIATLVRQPAGSRHLGAW